MKEIDTESTVIWPAWCYSDNIPTDILKQTPTTTTYIDIKTEIPIENNKTETSEKIEKVTSNPTSLTYTTQSDYLSKEYTFEKNVKDTYQNGDNNVTNKSPSPISEITIETATIKRNTKSTNKTFRQSKSTIKSNNSKDNYSQRDYLRSPKPPSQEAAALTSIPNSLTNVVAAAEKMISERSMLLNRFNALGSSKKLSNSAVNTPTSIITGDIATIAAATPTHPGAAAAYLYLEKLKNEKFASTNLTAAQLDSLKETIMESASIGNTTSNNNNNNNNNNNSNNNNNNSILSNNNNLLISHVQSNTSTASGGGGSGSCGISANSNITGNPHNQQHLQQQQNHCNSSNNNNNNSSSSGNCGVKRERLSPGGTNGELQSKLARSRCTTPSSFRGTTSPQLTLHNSSPDTLMPMHNLSTNLINSLQQAASSTGRQLQVNANLSNSSVPTMPTDFSTRNYSDIMRSLAAKYNNSLSNDNSLVRRNTFFENSASASSSSSNTCNNSKLSNTILKTNSHNPVLSSSLMVKELSAPTALAPPPPTTATLPPPPPTPLPPPALSPNFAVAAASLKSQNAQNQIAAAAAEAGVSPFMTSFLCSLPFVQGVFPPLIDMSSTQALLTLARAAKEAEIQKILQTVRNSKRSNSSASSSPRPNLNAALQQAAQFVSPTFIYSAQMQQAQQQQQQQQQQQHHHQHQQQKQSLARPASRQSNPRDPIVTATSSNDHTTSSGAAAPLDLSSQPPAAKRFKAESTSRRVSSTSLSASPSPALSERSIQNENSRDIKSTEATIVTSTKTNSANTNSRQCQAQSEEVNSWTVDEVCSFVGGIDICAEYVQHFRDQCIDGSGLPLLTEDHLVNSLGMKLGPALKLRSMLAKKLGGPCPCVACVAQTQQMLALQAAAVAAAATTTTKTTSNTTTATKSYNSKINSNVSAEATSAIEAGVLTNFATEVAQHTATNVTAASVGCSNKKTEEETQQHDATSCIGNNKNQVTLNVATTTPTSAACNNINNNDSNKGSNGSGSTSNITSSCNVIPNIGNNSIPERTSNDNSDVLAFIGHGHRGRSSSNSSHSSHSDAKRPASADFLGDGS